MASAPLELRFPIMTYDITRPLLEKRVQIEGVELKPERVPAMIFNPESPFRDGSFDVAELNIAYWPPAVEAGWPLIGLPLFIKRKPVYEYIFCRTDAGINSPRDLEGKRVGARQYRMSTTIWLRGLLQHRHGVDVAGIHWLVSAKETFPLHNKGANVEWAADPQKSMVDCLFDGDVDAIMTDISDRKLFQRLEASPDVHPLFPDYMSEDKKLFDETGLFTSSHLIVMNKTLDQQYPELAGKLFAAFQQAKQMAYDDILDDRAGFSVVYLRERLLEQFNGWGDPWRYGVKANKNEIDAFLQYNAEQGMTGSVLPYHEAFAGSTLET